MDIRQHPQPVQSLFSVNGINSDTITGTEFYMATVLQDIVSAAGTLKKGKSVTLRTLSGFENALPHKDDLIRANTRGSLNHRSKRPSLTWYVTECDETDPQSFACSTHSVMRG